MANDNEPTDVAMGDAPPVDAAPANLTEEEQQKLDLLTKKKEMNLTLCSRCCYTRCVFLYGQSYLPIYFTTG